MVEVFAFQELHDQKGLASRGGAEVEDLDDVRVPESAGHHGLAVKASQRFGIRCQLARHHLDRHTLGQAQVRRLVDGSHATLANQAIDPVRAVDQNGPNHRLRRLLVGAHTLMRTRLLHKGNVGEQIYSCRQRMSDAGRPRNNEHTHVTCMLRGHGRRSWLRLPSRAGSASSGTERGGVRSGFCLHSNIPISILGPDGGMWRVLSVKKFPPGILILTDQRRRA